MIAKTVWPSRWTPPCKRCRRITSTCSSGCAIWQAWFAERWQEIQKAADRKYGTHLSAGKNKK